MITTEKGPNISYQITDKRTHLLTLIYSSDQIHISTESQMELNKQM